MNVQPQYMYSGAQSGVVLIQTDAGVVPQIYPATGQQPVYIAQQVTIDVTYLLIYNKIQGQAKKFEIMEVWDGVLWA